MIRLITDHDDDDESGDGDGDGDGDGGNEQMMKIIIMMNRESNDGTRQARSYL